MLFVFAVGVHLFFWSFGYEVLGGLKNGGSILAAALDEDCKAPSTKTQRVWTILSKSFFNHLMLAMYLGIIIALVPGFQDILYSNDGFLRPLGDSIETIAQPCVCLNCLVMAGSLALTRKKGGRGGRGGGGGGGNGEVRESKHPSDEGDVELADIKVSTEGWSEGKGDCDENIESTGSAEKEVQVALPPFKR